MLFVSQYCLVQKDTDKDEVKIGKFEIKVFQNSDHTYGYSIYKEKELVTQQITKPFVSVPIGFSNKENAMKVAKWQVTQLQQNNRITRSMSIEEAKKIGITDEEFRLNQLTN